MTYNQKYNQIISEAEGGGGAYSELFILYTQNLYKFKCKTRAVFFFIQLQLIISHCHLSNTIFSSLSYWRRIGLVIIPCIPAFFYLTMLPEEHRLLAESFQKQIIWCLYWYAIFQSFLIYASFLSQKVWVLSFVVWAILFIMSYRSTACTETII